MSATPTTPGSPPASPPCSSTSPRSPRSTCAAAGPGTREEAALKPESTVETVDGFALSGGSALGLDAAGGVQAWLAEQGRGFEIRERRHPDRAGRDLLRSPQRRRQGLGTLSALSRSRLCRGSSGGTAISRSAASAPASAPPPLTSRAGLARRRRGRSSGAMVAALVVVNAVGSVTVGDGPWFWAAPFEVGGEYGGRGLPAVLHAGHARDAAQGRPGRDRRARTRRIAVVVTDATLTKAQAKRLRDDRADRHGARDLSGARAARRRCGVRGSDLREADRSRLSA